MILGSVYKNRKKQIYIAKKINTYQDDYGNEINEYGKPIPYKINVQPASGNFDLTLYGEKISKIYRAIVPFSFSSLLKEGDIAYLDGANPEGETINGDNANFFVDSIRPQNLATAIYFRRRE